MFPMGMVTQRMTQGRWRSKLITASTTWTVPPDVGCIWVDGCCGGGGGGGGDPTPGGGGGGGGPGPAIFQHPFPVTPSEVLTLTIGAAGTGGAAGANGTNGGATTLYRGTSLMMALGFSSGGSKGTPSAGGAGAAYPYGSGDVGMALGAPLYGISPTFLTGALRYYAGTAGGALSASGTQRNGETLFGGAYKPATAGNASGGGGGHGGLGPFSLGAIIVDPWTADGGCGGQNGDVGKDGLGYGAGGGGGSGNAAGGNGSPGFIRIYCFTAYEI